MWNEFICRIFVCLFFYLYFCRKNMKKTINILAICCFVILACASCDNKADPYILEVIKRKGDVDPNTALSMLDSVCMEMDYDNKYTRMKCMMLRMRLKDKSYIPSSSDDTAKVVVSYFEDKGTMYDKQEANYYAGSVYRDLQDTPKALEYFLKAEEYAVMNNGLDSILLRNTYSNLEQLYFNVQDYSNALKMAYREYKISKEINSLNINNIIHVGEVCVKLDSTEQAYRYFDEASKYANNKSPRDMFSLLYNFSYIKEKTKADSIYKIILSNDLQPNSMGDFALAEYYNLCGNADSAVVCYDRIVKGNECLVNSYDASRFLFDIYIQRGDIQKSLLYANLFMACSDSLDFGKRQELASTINNQFKYFKNIKEERRLIEENTNYRYKVIWLIIVLIVLSFSYLVVHLYRRNRHLKILIEMSNNLQEAQAETKRTFTELNETKNKLEKTKLSLVETERELENITREISNVENELRHKEQLLVEKLEENKRFVNMLHKADLEENSQDVITAVRNASEGRHKMTAIEWQKLYRAVDEQQPDLMEKIMHNLGKFTEQQLQVCYLLSIGFSNAQIENLTDVPHVTVWRWVKKFDWI